METKKTYYISIGNGQISQVKTADTYNFEISANDEEITELREHFDQAFVVVHHIGHYLNRDDTQQMERGSVQMTLNLLHMLDRSALLIP